jgi:hypothetical protein
MKVLRKKIMPKDKQIESRTRYVVKERMLYTTKEYRVKYTLSYFGSYQEKGDELELKGYFWSGEVWGGQYLVFRVLTGRAKGKEVSIYTREEYQNLHKGAKVALKNFSFNRTVI